MGEKIEDSFFSVKKVNATRLTKACKIYTQYIKQKTII